MKSQDSESRYKVASTHLKKKTLLESLGSDFLFDKLEEISDACFEVEEYLDNDERLLDALDGNEDMAFEFKFLFADIRGGVDDLYNGIMDYDFDRDLYDDCMVGLIGEHGKIIGYDAYEQGYYELATGLETTIAMEEAETRLMRLTKKDMIHSIRKAMSIFLATYDLMQKYDSLKSTIDILRGDAASIGEALRKANEMYDAAMDGDKEAERQLDTMISALPDRVWIE